MNKKTGGEDLSACFFPVGQITRTICNLCAAWSFNYFSLKASLFGDSIRVLSSFF